MTEVGWSKSAVIELLQRYTPQVPEDRTPILFDPIESYGGMLRVCATIGWRYVCKAPTQKIEKFFRESWAKHLIETSSVEQVRLFFVVGRV